MKQVIQSIQSQIKDGLFTNEASVIRGIINPILQKLNWPANDVRIVRPEYTVGNQRVDIALFHNNQPFIFIEAKKLEQLMVLKDNYLNMHFILVFRF